MKQGARTETSVHTINHLEDVGPIWQSKSTSLIVLPLQIPKHLKKYNQQSLLEIKSAMHIQESFKDFL